MTDDERLRMESAEIEQLLDEVRDLSAPPVWSRVEEVVRRLVSLYGAGLAHALAHARAAGADERLEQSCCDDDLLASLLVLHGLHPLSTEERIRRVLDVAHTRLGLAPDAVALVGVVARVAELRATSPIGGELPPDEIFGMIRRAIEAAAPELAEIGIAGEAATVPVEPQRQAG